MTPIFSSFKITCVIHLGIFVRVVDVVMLHFAERERKRENTSVRTE